MFERRTEFFVFVLPFQYEGAAAGNTVRLTQRLYRFGHFV